MNPGSHQHNSHVACEHSPIRPSPTDGPSVIKNPDYVISISEAIINLTAGYKNQSISVCAQGKPIPSDGWYAGGNRCNQG
ncbi:YALI0D02739p [Anopheles sinensis]|uniref:YALI0D02739p n=1 Tax=Anopheles sinensis TaxID=74873 RepID=A0A084WC24_ANOSI|nr:YALI0D02739p [Anopheles sinensis]